MCELVELGNLSKEIPTAAIALLSSSWLRLWISRSRFSYLEVKSGAVNEDRESVCMTNEGVIYYIY
jgi:hypothetical protein